MKKPFLLRRELILGTLLFFILFTACLEFETVNQPGSTKPSSYFNVDISIVTTDGYGDEYIPYFGIKLPVGWTVTDSIPFNYPGGDGILSYSDSLSMEMDTIDPAGPGYYWWVAAGTEPVIYNYGEVYVLSPEIHNDAQTGNFFLDYMGGSNGDYYGYGGLNTTRSNDHIITVGLPDNLIVTSNANAGPGSLREAMDNIDFNGTITFDLGANNEIVLDSQLVVYKNVHISGPVDDPVTLSGGNNTRVIYIPPFTSPHLSGLNIAFGSEHDGGGIYCDMDSEPLFENLEIAFNNAEDEGGGVFIYSASPTLSNVNIHHNSASDGAGIYCAFLSSPVFKDVVLHENSASYRGGGMYTEWDATPLFDSIDRCNIYLNNGLYGTDLYVNNDLTVVVDTFTVLVPTEIHAQPLELFTFDILNGKIEQVSEDLYVSPSGNNNNSGLTPDDPLKTINAAMLKILVTEDDPGTIHLLEGVFSPSSNGESFPMIVRNFTSLVGESVSSVVLDAEELSHILVFENNSSSTVKNMTLTGGMNNSGGAIYTYYSSPDLENLLITGNTATNRGGGIYFNGNSDPHLSNLTITANTCLNRGGGIYIDNSANPYMDTLNRCNIYLNDAVYGGDFYTEHWSTNIVVDTFSVLIPNEYHAYPVESFQFNILNGKVLQVEANLYVSPDGDNSNSGISADEPLKNIRFAYSKMLTNPDIPLTIYLLDGTYSPSTSDELFPLLMRDYVFLEGTGESLVTLDAEQMNRVIEIQNNDTCRISKLSITGGNAPYEGGGIYMYNSDPVIDHVILYENHADDGGGLFSYYSEPIITNTSFLSNHAQDYGGGIYFQDYGTPILQNVTVSNNTANRGAGMCTYYCDPSLSDVRIHDNTADNYGGGIFVGYSSSPFLSNVSIHHNTAYRGGGLSSQDWNSEPLFDTIDRSNIYLNVAEQGGDLYSSNLMDVIVDTFTVMYPKYHHAYPLSNFTFDILHGMIPQVEADLWVSPDGEDTNSGLTPDDPLKTISHALLTIAEDSLNLYAIHLLPGIYSPSSNGESFPLILAEYVNLEGLSPDSVIIDAEQSERVLLIDNIIDVNVSGLTIKGGYEEDGAGIRCINSSPVFENVVIRDNTSYEEGGGFYCEYQSNPQFINCAFVNNEASYSGGAIYVGYSCNVSLENGVLVENHADYGAGLYLSESEADLDHVIVAGNQASYNGGGIHLDWYSQIQLKSLSIYNNNAEKGGGIYCGNNSTVMFDSLLRSNIYLNTGVFGRDLYSDEIINVVVDTFSVLYPTEFFAYPFDNFTFDILNGKLLQVNADLYVSPNGNDDNSGLTADEPLKTINTAFSKIMADSTHQHTVWLLEGTYGPSSNGDNFPINMIDYITLSGISQSGVQLNGEDQYGILHFDDAHGTSVANMTLKRGKRDYGAAIYCNYSSPLLSNLTIMDNEAYNNGGGIYCSGDSDPQLTNLNFIKNKATYGGGLAIVNGSSPDLQDCNWWLNKASSRGGGVYIRDYSNPVIQDGDFHNNHADRGAGIYCDDHSDLLLNEVMIYCNHADEGGGIYIEDDCQIQLTGTDIFQNTAELRGGGIYSDNNISPFFDTVNRCNIYLNIGDFGRDLFSEHTMQVVVDTFTVLYPTKIFADPLPYFEFDILHGLIEQIDADLYVSPEGSDDNSGLTPEDPLKTINFANTRILADSSSPQTIHLLPGTYSDSTNGEVFPVNTLDYVNLAGTSPQEVMLHGRNQNRLLEIQNTVGTVVSGMTITGGSGNDGAGINIKNANPTLENLIIEDNVAGYRGGGINITHHSDPILHNITIQNNSAEQGGGIHCSYQSNAQFSQLVITNNTAMNDGGGMYIYDYCDAILDSVVFTQNISNYGGGALCIGYSNPILSNVKALNNSALYGGGLYLYESNIEMENTEFRFNSAENGGGIYAANWANSEPVLKNVTLAENTADNRGGGIYNYHSTFMFDSVVRSNIYLNYASSGSDLYSETFMEVIVDTFTVMMPKRHQADPLPNFSFDILHGLLNQEELELYVSPAGDDTNTGLSPDDPLKTINYAFDIIGNDSLNLYDVQLLEGTYSPSSNGEIFPVYLDDYVGLSGTSSNEVILDAEGSSNLLRIDNRRDIEITNLTLTGAGGYHDGGGIYMKDCNVSLENLILTNNEADDGGALYCRNTELTMMNTTITENTADNRGGGLYLGYDSDVSLENTSIQGNTSNISGGGIFADEVLMDINNTQIINNETSNEGGGLYCRDYVELTISQSLFCGNTAAYSGGAIHSDYSSLYLSGTSIRNNSAMNYGGGIYSQNNNTVMFDTADRCNIYLNEAQNASDLYSQDQMIVVVDTFTVLYPKAHHAYPLPNFTFDILNGKIPQVHADLYVSPAGNDGNTGLTPDEPLKTINYAMSIVAEDSVNIYTINLLEGTYGPSSNGEVFPVHMVHYVNLEGTGTEEVLLDGEGSSRVIEFNSVLQAGIFDLSITGGNAGNDDGGGIYCNHSSPLIERIRLYGNQANNGGGICLENYSNAIINDLMVENNEANDGGGIYCEYYSNPVLNNVSITHNTGGQGGGFAAYNHCSPIFTNVDLFENIATNDGGGIHVTSYSNPVLKNVDIKNNTAQVEGGGIWCSQNANLFFDTTYRSTIYLNTAQFGNELYSSNQMLVVVDTFTVLYPKSFHAYPRYNFEFDILVGLIPQVHADLYVSPMGDNSNSGLTPEDPLQTIHFATSIIAEDSLNMYTIHLANGIYSPSTNGEVFPVFLPEYIGIQGEHKYETILDAEQTAQVMHLSYNNDIIIKNLTIRNGYLPDDFGGGLYLEYSSPELSDVFVTQNYARYGGGIFLDHSNPVIDGLSVTYNETFYGGGGMCIYDESCPQITNSTIENNTAGTYGGGVYCSLKSSPHFKDVVFENNEASTGAALYSSNQSNPVLEQVLITNNEAEHSGGGIYAPYSNMKILDSEISNNTSTSKGGGIYLSSCNAIIENTLITNNLAKDGGGMYYSSSDPILVDVVITNNIVTRYGGGLYFSVSNPVLENLTIAGNEADMGSGIYCYRSDLNLMDAILWNEPLNEVWFKESGSPSSITLACSAIQDGEDAIVTNGNGTVTVVGDLMEEDPMFLGGDDHPHQLSEFSPYIDMGMIDTAGMHLPEADILGNCRIWDGNGNGIERVDLGAYEFGAPLIVGIKKPVVQGSRLKVQGYPNPFSERITLAFEEQKPCRVSITVSDITGNEVLLLADGITVRNNQKLSFNLGELDKGIYFLKISDGNVQETIKMVKIR